MVFSSLLFLFVFLPLSLGSYFLIPARRLPLRNLHLLIFSLVFYAWGEPRLIWCMLVCVLANWLGARAIAATAQQPWRRRVALATTLTVSLGMLVVFKYAAFAISNWNAVAVLWGGAPLAPNLAASLIMPIGISFYTFQAVSYTLDVYWKKVEPTPSLTDFAAYVTMFPQLVAGPIVRYETVMDELRSRTVDVDDFAVGVRRFLVGLLKKVILANALAGPADTIFALGAPALDAPLAWLGITCYALQIYFDFSAYSDMAIGMGRMFGFHFLENFDHPYRASSVRDFWHRWHISLSTWFRDYLFIPLGGSRGSQRRTFVNLWLVFLICGLWHGASWTFVVWGAFHGTFLVLERTRLGRALAALPKPVQHLYTLLVVLIGWVFFRAENLPAAFIFLKAMAGAGSGAGPAVAEIVDSFTALLIGVGLIGASGVPARVGSWALTRPSLNVALAAATALAFLVAQALLLNGSYNPFIYFRF